MSPRRGKDGFVHPLGGQATSLSAFHQDDENEDEDVKHDAVDRAVADALDDLDDEAEAGPPPN